jgi:hypothetical protein
MKCQVVTVVHHHHHLPKTNRIPAIDLLVKGDGPKLVLLNAFDIEDTFLKVAAYRRRRWWRRETKTILIQRK